MKIIFEPKAYKIVKGTILLIAVVMVAYIAYAATNIPVSNSVTITPANGIGVSITLTNPTTCPANGSASSYQTVAFSNANPWTIPAGGNSAPQWFCLENTGTGTDATPSIVMGLINGVTCTTTPCLTVATTPATIPPIAPGGISSPISVTVSSTSSASSSVGATFSLTVS
jgi:hypothetical protein